MRFLFDVAQFYSKVIDAIIAQFKVNVTANDLASFTLSRKYLREEH